MVKFGKFRNSLQHVDVHVLVSWGTGGGGACMYPSCSHAVRILWMSVNERFPVFNSTVFILCNY